MKIGIQCIALPPNNSMELTGQMRHVPCKKKSKGHAAFALQLMHERYTARELYRSGKGDVRLRHEAGIGRRKWYCLKTAWCALPGSLAMYIGLKGKHGYSNHMVVGGGIHCAPRRPASTGNSLHRHHGGAHRRFG